MLRARSLLVLMMIGSLLGSDAVAFLHQGQCGCRVGTLGDGREQRVGSCETGVCQHASNPFVKRRTVNATHEQAAGWADSGNGSPEVPDSSGSNHDSERCSLCRWLTIAREQVQTHAVGAWFERLPVSPAMEIHACEPIPAQAIYELSRRGPPAAMA